MSRNYLTFQEDPISTPIKRDSKDTFEVTHVNIRVSIVFLVLKLVALDILAILTALVFFWVISSGNLTDQVNSFLISNSAFYFLILAGVKLAFTLYIVIQWLNEYYEITPAQVIYRKGAIWRKVDIHDFSLVRSIGIQQSFLGRVLNYGTINIYDRGVYKYFFLNYIHNPHRYFKLLQSLCPNSDIEKQSLREHMHDEEAKP